MREYPITVILMVANVIFSYFGFQRAGWMEKYMFWVEKILIRKEYYRVISSGFLHVSLTHIVMNLLTLYYLGSVLEQIFAHKYGPIGSLIYVLIYFGSMLGGDILSLMMHRNHPDYTAVGASGAISGVVFALVLLDPYEWILLFGLIIPMQYWWYAVYSFVLYSLFWDSHAYCGILAMKRIWEVPLIGLADLWHFLSEHSNRALVALHIACSTHFASDIFVLSQPLIGCKSDGSSQKHQLGIQ